VDSELELVPPERIQEEVATDRYFGGLLFKKSAQMHMGRFGSGLAEAAARVSIEYCWGGLVDMTQDRLPHAGEKDGLFYSMGYSGHGAQMSVHMGECKARVMAGDAAANPWRSNPWPAIPGHFAPPGFCRPSAFITGSRTSWAEPAFFPPATTSLGDKHGTQQRTERPRWP